MNFPGPLGPKKTLRNTDSGEGVITENCRDEQRKVIKYNHLVANCLIFHNVCSLTKLIGQLQEEGESIQQSALACVSPYRTEHINPIRSLRVEYEPEAATRGL
jgi:ribosomal protein L30E